jgi:hypothetical protein
MSQKPPQPNENKVHIKFNVDESSKEASEKLKTENFIESVNEYSKTIRKNPPKKK